MPDQPETTRFTECGATIATDTEVCGRCGADQTPWHIVITRYAAEGTEHFEDIVIGPFATEALTEAYLSDSLDVEDWCTGEAKAKGYVVDDAYYDRLSNITVPKHGINAPLERDLRAFEPQNETEALSLAIFAINTLLEPSASEPDHITELEERAQQVIATLHRIRERYETEA